MQEKIAIKEMKSILKDYRDTMTKDLEQALVNYIKDMKDIYIQNNTKKQIKRKVCLKN